MYQIQIHNFLKALIVGMAKHLTIFTNIIRSILFPILHHIFHYNVWLATYAVSIFSLLYKSLLCSLIIRTFYLHLFILFI